MWTCPACRAPLESKQGKSLVCSAGHCYDIAREGYVNLLPAHRKRSQQPGDNKAMIAARWRVHEAGLYQPLVAAMQEQLAVLANPESTVLDMGCGEGYYCAAVRDAMPAAKVYGIDLAKPAVKLAAKNCPGARFAVASVIDVPLPDSSLDLVASVFAPVDERELLRLLVPGGNYLKITPAARHLWELRCLLYDRPRPHRSGSPQLAGFESLVATELNYALEISGELLRDLVAMTPYAHRGQRENRDKIAQIEELEIQMCFDISVQCRCPDEPIRFS